MPLGLPAPPSASASGLLTPLDSKSNTAVSKSHANQSRHHNAGAHYAASKRKSMAAGDPASRNLDLQNYVINKIELHKRNQFSIKKLTQLCSFIPDFILNDEHNQKIPYLFSLPEAVVLMADISGFTALTEAYSLRGKGGTDQLTKTLAGYIGPLAECILLAEGDIVKYAGDAFLAYWKSTPEEYDEDVKRVIDCALYIQEKYGSHLCKEVDITIRVKIGIGAGVVHFSGIGTEAYQHWVAFGPGVRAASDAEKHCVPGDVVLHPDAWKHCQPRDYRYVMKEAPFVHMLEMVNQDMKNEKRGRPRDKINTRGRGGKSEFVPIMDMETIRPQIADFVQQKSESIMRPFVIPTVLRKLDDDVPVEFLNESRLVVICFIHVKYDEKIDQDQTNFRENMGTLVQKAFVRIYVNVTKLQGALSKVIMFDKGLTYLIVFGLPGYTNENQSTRALKFAYRTRLALKSIARVTDVSIGVTTGNCYCGVIGHPRRKEYTVIGRKVNKAARLMVYYPGRLTCDQDTCYFSKLPLDNFLLMEAKELKGIKDVGKIYEFVNADSSDDNSIPFFQYPLLGRSVELKYFKTALQYTKKELDRINEAALVMPGASVFRALGQDSQANKGYWMIVIEGDSGMGKSRLLAACIDEAEAMNFRVFNVGMTLATSSQQFFALSCLMIDALGMLELRTVQEREDYLKKHVSDPELVADLCLLNEVLHTKFPLHQKYTAMDVNACHTYGQHVLATLLKNTYPKDVVLFVIDDSHHMDLRSWEYLGYICKFPNVFVLCSLRRSNAGTPKLADVVSKQIYHNKEHIKILRIHGLEPDFLVPLACQIMECKAVQADLERLMINKSQGVPAWISQVLNELLRVGTLRMQDGNGKGSMTHAKKEHLLKITRTPKKYFRRWAQEEDSELLGNAPNLASAAAATSVVNPLTRVLVVKSDTDIRQVKVSGTLKEIMLDQLDELESNEQVLLKAATVLGSRFSRKMLTRLLPMYEKKSSQYDQSFIRLMEQKYFRCASGTAKQKEAASAINARPQCFCRMEEYSGQEEDALHNKKIKETPKFHHCRFTEFVKETMVDVVYEVMTEDQRAELHLKAAKYFDSSIIRCESCGGEDRSYLFGFTKKSSDYTVDADDTIRLNKAKRLSLNQQRGERRKLSNLSFHNGDRRKRTLITELEGLKRTYQSGGAKLGSMELDILKGLMEFDKENRGWSCWNIFCCRCRNRKELEQEEEELRKFEEMHAEEAESDVKRISAEPADEPTDPSEAARNSEPGAGLGRQLSFGDGAPNDAARHNSYMAIDLRMCQCALLQAKICVEMVFHYRESKKWGRCLQNLLDAAESDITVGNGSQALVHIEDAMVLMQSIRQGEFIQEQDDQDDSLIDEKEADAQIEFLSGLAYFEIGINNKARDFFLKALHRLGLTIKYDDAGVKRNTAIYRAKVKLCRVRNCACCSGITKIKGKNKESNEQQLQMENMEDEIWRKKIRILGYLHDMFKSERKMEMALLVTIWQVILAEQHGELIHDIIPAYSNMMECYSALSKFRDAKRYERYALDLARSQIGMEVDVLGLIMSANLFLNVASSRLNRGEIESSIKAAYLALRIAQVTHDNALIIRILPLLTQGLILSLRITEVAEALQRLWFLAEEGDDWVGVSRYYALCLDLLLNTAYPLEQFCVCENFVTSSEWAQDAHAFRDSEAQYSLEASLALHYARYSRWEPSQSWFDRAEKNRPKHHNFVTVISELKLLECQLITVNHFLDSKRYQHFAKARNKAKELMRTLTKAIAICPVAKPRFHHLMAYYYRIRSRNVESEKQLKAGEKLARKMGDFLELEWIAHSRTVWNDMAIPTIKYFWLEHVETHTLDWHSSGKIPWANIMFSMPLPAWK